MTSYQKYQPDFQEKLINIMGIGKYLNLQKLQRFSRNCPI
jgi:hypothetical protein